MTFFKKTNTFSQRSKNNLHFHADFNSLRPQETAQNPKPKKKILTQMNEPVDGWRRRLNGSCGPLLIKAPVLYRAAHFPPQC